MKITGNENGKPLASNLVTQESIDSISTRDKLLDTIFFNSLEVSVAISEADYEQGLFKVQLSLAPVQAVPNIVVSLDNKEIAKDLFTDSKVSAENRAGILGFIKAGVLSALTNSFSETVFNDHLQILDEKLKSKVLEIRQSNIDTGSLVKTEEVPQLITGEEDLPLEVSKTDVIKEQKELTKAMEAQGFEDLDDLDDEMPENYKPLSDGTNDGQPIEIEDDEDDGQLEPCGRLSH